MKICAAQAMIAILLCGMSMANTGYSQLLEKEITISLKDVPLESALNEISKAADIKIAFSVDQLNVKELVSVEANRTPLKELLDDLFTPLNIRYKISDNDRTIFLKRDGKSKLQFFKSTSEDDFEFYEVRGTVVDKFSGLPLAGVNVIVKGTTNGTTTDAEGTYVLRVKTDDILVFSFIGYTSLEIEINGQTVIDVTLAEDIKSLGEVTVFSTGYDDVPVERSTGSFSQLSKDLLERNVGPDINSRLNGLAPSLLMDQRSGNRTFLNIRGRSTISANDQPLIVVDNFPYNGDINTINPNDIETITVLRDAAAASIWGIRAGNGVIVITTKRGSANQQLQVGINSNVTFGERPDLFYERRMSTGSFIDMEKFLFDQGFFDNNINDTRKPAISPVIEILLSQRNGDIDESGAAIQLDALRGNDVRNDMLKYLYQNSIQQQYAVNVSGGTEKHSFFMSSGWDSNRKNLRENSFQRLSLNLQNTFKPFRNFELDSRVVYTESKDFSDLTSSNITMGTRDIYPYARLKDDAGNSLPITHQYRHEFSQGAENIGLLDWKFIPLEELGRSDRTNRLENIRLSTSARYNIVEGLSIDIRHQFERQRSKFEELNPVESYFSRNLINQFSTISGSTVTRNIPLGGIRTISNSELQAHNGRLQLNLNTSRGKHAVTALAGLEIREVTSENYTTRFYGYDVSLGSSSPVNYTQSYRTYPLGNFATIPGFSTLGGTIDRFRSYFANGAYTWNRKYTLSLSGRIDQSNLFGVTANQRSNPLWSTGGKWQINSEDFYRIAWMPQIALRATYGFSGNIDQSITALTTAVFTTNLYTSTPAAFVQNPPNPDLRWEKSRMINVGLDFTLLNEIVTGNIEFYQKKGIDLLGQGPLDPTTGRNSFKGNVASMKGHGWDVELRTNNLNKKIKWSTSFLFSFTTDRVTKYDLKSTSIANHFIDNSINRFAINYAPVENRPVFSIYSFKSAGLDPETGNPRGYLNGQPSLNYTDITSRATVDSLIYHGPALPTHFGALRNSISFKGLTLSFNVTYRLGYFFRRNSIHYNNLFTSYRNAHADYENRWRQPGDEATTYIPSLIYPANSGRDTFYNRTEHLIDRGDHIRLQDLQLAYNFNTIALGKLDINRLQIYGYLNNIGILWRANKNGIDPDFPTMPLPRTYAIGLRIDF